MANNSENDIKLVSYKELARKKALDYYYANRKVIMEKNRKGKELCHLKKKRRDMSLIDNGITDNHLKKKAEMKQKQKEYCKKRYNNMMVEVK